MRRCRREALEGEGVEGGGRDRGKGGRGGREGGGEGEMGGKGGREREKENIEKIVSLNKY